MRVPLGPVLGPPTDGMTKTHIHVAINNDKEYPSTLFMTVAVPPAAMRTLRRRTGVRPLPSFEFVSRVSDGRFL
jgi:hypothetical protein